jgi:hypothetical protein
VNRTRSIRCRSFNLNVALAIPLRRTLTYV